jgi:hypothetical protein
MKHKIYDILLFVGGTFFVIYGFIAGQYRSGGFRNWAGPTIAIGCNPSKPTGLNPL